MRNGAFATFAESLVDKFYGSESFLPTSAILSIITTIFGTVAWFAPDAPRLFLYFLPVQTAIALLMCPVVAVGGTKDWRKLDQLSNVDFAKHIGSGLLWAYVAVPGLLIFGVIRGVAEAVGLCGRKTISGLKRVIPEPGPQVTGSSAGADVDALVGDVLEECGECGEVHEENNCPWAELKKGAVV